MTKTIEKIKENEESDLVNKLHIYMRVSSTIQKEEGDSLERQKDVGIQKSKSITGINGYEIYNEMDKSGRKNTLENRDEINRLLNNIDKGLVKHVFCWNLDRLSRNTKTWGIIRLRFVEKGITLHTNTGVMDLSSPEDNLLLGFLSEFTQYESGIRETRLIEGKYDKVVNEGNWKGGIGVYGYSIENRKLVENPSESKHVKTIFEMYGNNKSILEIVSYLQRKGIPTKYNNSNSTKSFKHKAIWRRETVEKILRNTYYRGYFNYGKHKNIPCDKILSDKLIIPVDKRLKELKENPKYNYPRKKGDYYLTTENLMSCGVCGGSMGGMKTGSYKSSHGKVEVYFCRDRIKKYYDEWGNNKDIGNWKRGKSTKGCDMNKSLDCEITDNLVFDVVNEVVKFSNIKRESFKKETLKKGIRSKQDKDKETTQFKRKILNLKRLLENYGDNLGELEVEKIEKTISKINYNKVKKKLLNKMNEYETEIQSLNTQIGGITEEKEWVDWYSDFINDRDKETELKGKDRIEYIKRNVENISVFLDETRQIHILKIKFNIPIVNDKLIWKDKSNKKLGYDLMEGKDIRLLLVKKKQRLDLRKFRNVVY